MITGPIRESIDVSDGTRTKVTVAGQPGEMIVRSSMKGPGELFALCRQAVLLRRTARLQPQPGLAIAFGPPAAREVR